MRRRREKGVEGRWFAHGFARVCGAVVMFVVVGPGLPGWRPLTAMRGSLETVVRFSRLRPDGRTVVTVDETCATEAHLRGI